MTKPIARNIDDPAKILGLAPLEIASLGVFYAILSSVLRGVPFAALLCLIAIGALAALILTLNRLSPPMHGVFLLLTILRPGVTPVMRGQEERNGMTHDD